MTAEEVLSRLQALKEEDVKLKDGQTEDDRIKNISNLSDIPEEDIRSFLSKNSFEDYKRRMSKLNSAIESIMDVAEEIEKDEYNHFEMFLYMSYNKQEISNVQLSQSGLARVLTSIRSIIENRK